MRRQRNDYNNVDLLNNNNNIADIQIFKGTQ